VPRFSIVVPARNAADLLPELLRSLLRQDYPRDRYEVLVVDNASEDGTRAVAARFPVIVLREGRVASSYAARNAGVRAASGEWIAFTDADCVADPGWLRALASATGDGVGAVAGGIRAFPPRAAVERFCAHAGSLDPARTLQHPHLPYAQTANVAYAAEVFRRIGLFRPELRSGGDADLGWRMLQETGLRLAVAPAAMVLHRHRSDLGGLLRQWRSYGWGAAQLTRLHGAPAPRAVERTAAAHALSGLARGVARLPLSLGALALGRSDAGLFLAPYLLGLMQAAFVRGFHAGQAGPLGRQDPPRLLPPLRDPRPDTRPVPPRPPGAPSLSRVASAAR